MTMQKITVPDLGDVHDVPVAEIAVNVGDTVTEEQTLLSLESDKSVMELPSPAAGKITEIHVSLGDTLNMGDLVMTVEVTASDSAAETEPDEQNKAEETVDEPPEKPSLTSDKLAEAAVTASGNSTPAADFSGVHASPSVRRYARQLGVDLNLVAGTGPKARITQADVTAFIKTTLQSGNASGTASGIPALPEVDYSKFGDVETVPLARIRKLSAKHLHRSWINIPHVTQFDHADITDLEAFRQAEKTRHEVKITPLAFIMKASALALKKFPDFNCALVDGGESLLQRKYFHIGFAADTPNGLVVPVVRDIDQKSILQIAEETATLAAAARAGKLTPAQMSGGCFSISSLGGIGGTAFTPIVNAPEVAILGVSKSSMQPVWNGQEFLPRLQLPLSLSYDHRVIDGAAAARFTGYLAELLADIRRLLL